MAEITRKQIERAIAAHDIDKGGISEALGGWGWDAKAPDYVREKWRSVDRKGFGAALARWRDSLPVARWDAERQRYILTPPATTSHQYNPSTADREQAIAWGYTIEPADPVFTGRPTPGHAFVPGSAEHGHEHQCAAPEPDGMRQCGYPEAAHEQPAEDSPERLKARREALGWTPQDAADAVSKIPSRLTGRPVPWRLNDVMITESEHADEYAQCRAHYAAALSAAEAEARRAAKPDPLAYTDSPAFDEPAYSTLRQPAPEVVDVPQPEPWHARLVRLAREAQAAGKACAEAEAAFAEADLVREKTRLIRAAAREACHAARKALTAATTAAAIVEAAEQPVPQPERLLGDA